MFSLDDFPAPESVLATVLNACFYVEIFLGTRLHASSAVLMATNSAGNDNNFHDVTEVELKTFCSYFPSSKILQHPVNSNWSGQQANQLRLVPSVQTTTTTAAISSPYCAIAEP